MLNKAPTERVTSWANSGLLDLQLSSDYRSLRMTNLLVHPAVLEKLIVLSGKLPIFLPIVLTLVTGQMVKGAKRVLGINHHCRCTFGTPPALHRRYHAAWRDCLGS